MSQKTWGSCISPPSSHSHRPCAGVFPPRPVHGTCLPCATVTSRRSYSWQSAGDGTLKKTFLKIWTFKLLLRVHLWWRNLWFPHGKELPAPEMKASIQESQTSALNRAVFTQRWFWRIIPGQMKKIRRATKKKLVWQLYNKFNWLTSLTHGWGFSQNRVCLEAASQSSLRKSVSFF